MIDVLNHWMSESTQNFNIIVGLTMALYVGSLTVLLYIVNKFGKPDERTNAIYLKIISCMFTTQLIMSTVFITFVDGDIQFFRQFFVLFQAVVFLVGAIYAFRLYKKDYK
ncbi:6-aminohexanoate hydrolase [Paenibacillus turicensis]|uniref:6-aminohexanoate hydrolase n=1 Tax=Paenibacillus turicensis TaxID=160487 RepID=UPI003D2C53C9